MQSTQLWIWVALLALAAAKSALFTSIEVAVVRARRARLEDYIESGKDRVEAVKQVDRELYSGLLVARVGIVFGAVLAGWVGAVGFGPAARNMLGAEGNPVLGALAVFLVYLIVGILIAAFGHLAPRSFALARQSQDASRRGVLFRIIWALTLPLASVASWLAGVLLWFSRSADAGNGQLSEDELNLLMLSSYRRGNVGGAQRDLINRVFGHKEDHVRDCLTPRSEMACISSAMRVGDALEVARQFGFTRFPVCEGGKDRVIGIVHYRDLIDAKETNARQPVTDVMRPTVCVAPDLPVSEALATMQQHRMHMAIVTDDSGSALGLVTMEDLLSNMVSEPVPADDMSIRAIGKGVYEFGGDLLVEEVEDALDIDFQNVGVESIGGYLFGKFGRKPKEGDSIKIAGIVFDVLEVRGARIRRLRAMRSREAVPVNQDNLS